MVCGESVGGLCVFGVRCSAVEMCGVWDCGSRGNRTKDGLSRPARLRLQVVTNLSG